MHGTMPSLKIVNIDGVSISAQRLAKTPRRICFEAYPARRVFRGIYFLIFNTGFCISPQGTRLYSPVYSSISTGPVQAGHFLLPYSGPWEFLRLENISTMNSLIPGLTSSLTSTSLGAHAATPAVCPLTITLAQLPPYSGR